MKNSKDGAIERMDAFVRAAYASSGKIYGGIDPGFSGAIAFICGVNRVVFDMPTYAQEISGKTKGGKAPKRNYFDNMAIVELFDRLRGVRELVRVALEKGSPRPQDTALTGFAVGCGYGMWPLFLLAAQIGREDIVPGVWKRRFGLIKAKGAVVDKKASVRKARELWPTEDLPISRDGRAEALLIAEYLRLKDTGR